MSFLVTIFFISLVGLVLLIGRRIIFLRSGGTAGNGEFLFEIPTLRDLQVTMIRNGKKMGYNGLVGTIKFYVKSSHLLKRTHGKVREKVQTITKKYSKDTTGEQKGASKFLKSIANYKQKLRKIQHKIKEEEGLM